MAIEAKQFEDAEFAAKYFAEAGDPNAAQRKLSEDGAQINLMVVTICLAKEVQKLRGVGTEKHDEELLADENTPASQKDAIQRGIDNKGVGESSEHSSSEDSKTPSSNLPTQPQISSETSSDAAKTNHPTNSDSSTSLNINK
jgi:hypothetical protein